MWSVDTYLILSLSLFFLSIIVAALFGIYNKRYGLRSHASLRFMISPFHVMTVGVFVSAVILLYPAVRISIGGTDIDSYITTLLVSMQNTLQLFTIDADFGLISGLLEVEEASETVYKLYYLYGSMLHIIAPVLTASIVLSFFKNAKAFIRYYISFIPANLYVISELNDRSLALAANIIEHAKSARERAIVVFTDVFEQKEDEKNYEMVVRARALGCILFARDITQIRLRPSFGEVSRKIYFISEDEDENIKQSLEVISSCRRDKRGGRRSVYNTNKTEFYVFARSAESEVLLNSIDNGNMKVRRIDENRNFVLRTLMEHPIFNDALPALEGRTDKRLNIILVGLGMIGTEFVKAITWIGQMYGYELTLHIFDGEPEIEARLRAIAPELIDNNFAHMRERRADESILEYYTDKTAVSYDERIDGECYYRLRYYDEINVKTQEFLDIIDAIDDVSTVYVTLGDDELNIETAMRLRMQFERGKIKENTVIPSIYAVVYSEIKNTIITGHDGLRTFKNDDYGITLVGSLRSSYNLAALEQKNIEKAGLDCHLKWSNSDEEKKSSIESYSKYEYYRRSSMAEALHAFFREQLGLVPNESMDPALVEEICKYEHCRWSAFIRSEGYIYAPVKSDLAKTHKSLRPYDELSNSVRLLDKIVISDILDTENE